MLAIQLFEYFLLFFENSLGVNYLQILKYSLKKIFETFLK